MFVDLLKYLFTLCIYSTLSYDIPYYNEGCKVNKRNLKICCI